MPAARPPQRTSPHVQQPDHSAWTLTDGHAGNVRQATALADALGLSSLPVHLRARAPWRWWAPRRIAGEAHAFGDDFARRLAQAPAWAIGCGRQAALATRLLRGPRTRGVQILDPRIDPRHWDAVVVPKHDRVRGANVITLLGSLHPVDDAWLAHGRASFAAFAALPRPRVALLVGGPAPHWPVDDAALLRAVTDVADQAREAGGSVLATASRRTPDVVRETLPDVLAGVPHAAWRDLRDGANPYAGLLAWADAIACTADSVNMLSEACATHAPVLALDASTARGRVGAFVQALQARGRVLDSSQAWLAAARLHAQATPLRETARVAEELRARLA